VRFTTAAARVHELIEVRDEKRLLRFQKNLARHEPEFVHDQQFLQAASPSARPMCVLPVPELPNASTFSLRPIHSQRASSTTSFLFKEGTARKSYVSKLLVTGNLAALIRRSAARRYRSTTSCSRCDSNPVLQGRMAAGPTCGLRGLVG
jgi:hypothetical protein